MSILTKTRFAAACLALSAWLPLQAQAGLLDDDEARKAILELRAKVDNIKRELEARIDAKSDKTAALEMVNQNEQVMSELAKLRGQIEVLSNELVTAQKRQKDFYADLDSRIRKLEPRQVTVDGREAAVDPNEERTFEAANAVFKSGDYKGAINAYGDFVRRYPASVYAPAAQYGLGNSYWLQRDYKNAIAAQEVVVSNYRDSPRAPDAMLNIATSYLDLKDAKKAKKAFQDLVKQYPDSTAAQAAKDRLATLK